MTDKIVQIGATKKPHGLKGEVKLHVEEKYIEDLQEVEVVILTIKGKPTPFFVEDIRFGNAIIAKFEDVDTLEAATEIANKELSLREKDLIPDDEREFEIEGLQYEKCVGYTILDKGTAVGVIEEVLEFPQQEMAFIEYEGREVMIPLHPHFILKVDNAAKTIAMDLPDGLLEL
jgi:16S rRNA processing protein RimM